MFNRELSALRAPIAEINRHFDEGKDVEALNLHAIENATDVFNEVSTHINLIYFSRSYFSLLISSEMPFTDMYSLNFLLRT